MQRPPSSRVRHGMASCGEYGCGRPECVAAMRRARARRKLDICRGLRQRVPAEPTRVHIGRLLLAGVSVREMAEQSGAAHTTISRIRSGAAMTIWRSTADAVLGIRLPEMARPGGLSYVPAVGSVRRLQALAARGFTLTAVAGALECSTRLVFMVRSGKRRSVHVETHQAVARLYERWWNADPVENGVAPDRVKACIGNARQHGWASSGHWDDEALDDPAGFPDWTGACGTSKGYTRHRKNIGVPLPCQPCKDAEAARRAAAVELVA